MLGLVRHAWACQNLKITKCQYLWDGFSYFVYLMYIATHLWKLQCYHVILVDYGPASPKLSEMPNFQYLWKEFSGIEVSSWFFATKKLQKTYYFGLWSQKTLRQSVRRIFYFWLVWLVNLNIEGRLLHCTCLPHKNFVYH